MKSRTKVVLRALVAPLMLCAVTTGVQASGQAPAAPDTPQVRPAGPPPGMRAPMPFSVERLDPAIDAIVPQDAQLETVANGFTWVEGPVWIKSGYLLFAEITTNSIRKLMPEGTLTTFLQPSGFQGAEAYGGKEPGSNGMTLDARGRLTVAGHAQRDVYRLESLAPGAKRTVLADSYEGKKLNSPNDLVYRSDGSVYFTDPPYGLRKQSDSDPDKELAFSGVYRIPNAAAQKPGAEPNRKALQLLVKDLTRPNGIAFSPDEKYLYVSNTEPKRMWMRYPVNKDGSLGEGTVFLDASTVRRPGSPDGMKVDVQGNLYSAGPGGVWIISPEGKHLGTLRTPEGSSNVAWGGADYKTLYITMTGSVRRIHLNVAGVRPVK